MRRNLKFDEKDLKKKIYFLILLIFFPEADIRAQAAFSQNTFFLGGSFQTLHHAYNYNTNRVSNIQVSPTFGYFLFKNFAVGIGVSAKYERYYDAASLYPQFDDLTSFEYSLSPFVRYYFPTKANFGFLAQLQGTYHHLSPKNYFTPAPTDRSISASAGIYYLLNNSVSLEVLFTDKISDRSYGDLVFNDTKRTNTVNLSIGVQCYIGNQNNRESETIEPAISRGAQTLGGTFNWTNSDSNPTNNFSARPSYGYFIFKNLAIEARAFYETTCYQTSSSNYQDKEYGAGLSISYYQKIFRRLYIVPSMGMERSHYEMTANPTFAISTRHAFEGSINLNYFISNSFALEAGVGQKIDIFDQPIISPDKLARYNDIRGFIGFKYFIKK